MAQSGYLVSVPTIASSYFLLFLSGHARSRGWVIDFYVGPRFPLSRNGEQLCVQKLITAVFPPYRVGEHSAPPSEGALC